MDLPHKGILQSPALTQYIYGTSVYPREHEQLKKIWEATIVKYGNLAETTVPVDEGRFLSLFMEILNPKRMLEIGVFTGYSLFSTALAMPNDGLQDEKLFDFAFVDANKTSYNNTTSC
ncbi:unnamed protein product [Linum tenue]|uniref:Caffeoyl-CoA O-methyltransferase n=1 Tax=Linum tenue TaxID=586396 RepID=A0AAV0LDI8_9ROSI|nr:unnamed protein product [Linum tenue]